MGTLSSPISLIKRTFSIFFEKNNMIYFMYVASVPFLVSIASYFLSMYAASLGYNPDNYMQSLPSGDPFLIFYVLVWGILSGIIGLWGSAATYKAVINVVDNGSLDFRQTYVFAWGILWKFLLVSLVTGLIIMFGLILLVIPALIFGTWYSFSSWQLVSKNTGVVDSLKESKRLVNGKFWKVFGRFFVFAVYTVLIYLTFGMIPNGYGQILSTLFAALSLIPYYLLYQEVSRLG